MKKLDHIDYSICRLQGRVFEQSLKNYGTSSPVFIRRFMNSQIANAFDDRSILLSPLDVNGILSYIDDIYGKSNFGLIKYESNVIYWIGYFYRVLSFYYDLPSKVIYKMFKLQEIKDFYNIGHTFDPEIAAQKIMETKNFDNDYTNRGINILKRLVLFDKLKQLIDKNVKVIIDRPIGYTHEDIIYTQNYGYINGVFALDGESQDAYIIGIDKPLKEFEGKVIGIIKRKDDIEDKLIVCEKNKNYTNKEIEKLVDFQEKFFNYKIIR